MPHASVPTSNVAICRARRVVTQHKTAEMELAMRDRARVTAFSAPTAPVCGTGDALCATNSCQSGNCTWPDMPTTPPDWSYGNSTDGTCGGANRMTCGSLFGECCNQNNVCGSLPSDCGVGCQPEWGTCNIVTSSSLASSSTTTTSGSKSSSITTTSGLTSSSTAATSSTVTTSSPTSTLPPISSFPSCGQLCFNNLIGQYSTLGCSSPNPSCLCSNVNFGYSIRDCSNRACRADVASTVIAYETAYCSSALATATHNLATASSTAALPSCGQTCFNSVLAQYSSPGCATADPSCLCKNINFYYSIRDCSTAVCSSDTNAVSTILAFESSYCASATAAPTAK
ncbi:hypothetical protein V500_04559 [Pseudogymnoascus sp. VKM F-4518 (FW-2643)]|nr:hypothetical protein V500_04559 [Pseudogymnoascus sp. VKM F-4518 (FW-2643)]